MKIKVLILVAIMVSASTFLASCLSNEPGTDPGNAKSGSAEVQFTVGRVGALAKTAKSAAIEMAKLYIQFTADGETSIYDTIALSGNEQIIENKIYSDMAELKEWTLTAETRDSQDSLIHSGSTEFTIQPGQTKNVSLDLTASYSMLVANFFPIRDSVTRCELLVGSILKKDSSFAKQSLLGDTVSLEFDYLSASETGVSHTIKMDVYGDILGFDTLLYTGETIVIVTSGEDATSSLTLDWVGPDILLPEQVSMSVVLGAVGSVAVDGQLGDTTIDLRDGKIYKKVAIGTQTWMAENLNYSPSSGNSWCYDDDSSNCAEYGRLYDWNTAVADNHGNGKDICPLGWHLPSDAEWTDLENWVGAMPGKKLKSDVFWDGTDDFGFSALPGGYRGSNGTFYYLDSDADFWTATEFDAPTAWGRHLYSNIDGVSRSYNAKNGGNSVRCLKD